MSKIDEAREVLAKIGMPADQQGDICCLSLLALAGLGPQDGWLAATRCWLRIHDIIEFISLNYGVSYAENSRETFRKQAMHPSGLRRSSRTTMLPPTVPITCTA